MYYIGTVLLNMDERTFWKCTPRKLFALLDVHLKINGLDEGTKKKANKENNDEAIKSLMSW